MAKNGIKKITADKLPAGAGKNPAVPAGIKANEKPLEEIVIDLEEEQSIFADPASPEQVEKKLCETIVEKYLSIWDKAVQEKKLDIILKSFNSETPIEAEAGIVADLSVFKGDDQNDSMHQYCGLLAQLSDEYSDKSYLRVLGRINEILYSDKERSFFSELLQYKNNERDVKVNEYIGYLRGRLTESESVEAVNINIGAVEKPIKKIEKPKTRAKSTTENAKSSEGQANEKDMPDTVLDAGMILNLEEEPSQNPEASKPSESYVSSPESEQSRANKVSSPAVSDENNGASSLPAQNPKSSSEGILVASTDPANMLPDLSDAQPGNAVEPAQSGAAEKSVRFKSNFSRKVRSSFLNSAMIAFGIASACLLYPSNCNDTYFNPQVVAAEKADNGKNPVSENPEAIALENMINETPIEKNGSKETEKLTYTVQKKDTLWGIAKTELAESGVNPTNNEIYRKADEIAVLNGKGKQAEYPPAKAADGKPRYCKPWNEKSPHCLRPGQEIIVENIEQPRIDDRILKKGDMEKDEIKKEDIEKDDKKQDDIKKGEYDSGIKNVYAQNAPQPLNGSLDAALSEAKSGTEGAGTESKAGVPNQYSVKKSESIDYKTEAMPELKPASGKNEPATEIYHPEPALKNENYSSAAKHTEKPAESVSEQDYHSLMQGKERYDPVKHDAYKNASDISANPSAGADESSAKEGIDSKVASREHHVIKDSSEIKNEESEASVAEEMEDVSNLEKKIAATPSAAASGYYAAADNGYSRFFKTVMAGLVLAAILL
ncbi:MAG TPA: LysM domain-containing protein [Candidatus Nanoarchaeia archaeon]|nr:LysM domain-containing protein [Candidatus Nanoarchaeia archaeon]